MRLSASTRFATVSATILAKASQVRLMIFDVDGVLTDGGLFYGADGEPLKRFNALDGHGIKMLAQHGITSAIISARESPIVLRRARDLGISQVFQGIHDKRTAFAQLLQQSGMSAATCGYIGDDVIDLPILVQVGFSASVANGHPAVRERVDYTATAAGGNGGAREICDLILHSQGHYEAALAAYQV